MEERNGWQQGLQAIALLEAVCSLVVPLHLAGADEVIALWAPRAVLQVGATIKDIQGELRRAIPVQDSISVVCDAINGLKTQTVPNR